MPKRWKRIAALLLTGCLLPGVVALGLAEGAVLAPDTGLTWTALPARLNQRMATRSGPSTDYTEELGTMPQATEITVIWQEMGSVPWALVEYTYRGGLYRAYTGMKRIDIAQDVPWVEMEPVPVTLARDVEPHYGPGERYVPLGHTLHRGMHAEVCGEDGGYALIDYLSPADGEKRVRSWVPLEAVDGYPQMP